MTDRELMQQALEALELYVNYEGATTSAENALTALRERLAQPETVMAEYKFQTYAAYKTDGEMKIGVVPEQEPVAWMYEWDGRRHLTFTDQRPVEKAHPHFNKSTPLYTTPQPRTWVGLTDEEIMSLLPVYGKRPATKFARAVEAKLKEKNNG